MSGEVLRPSLHLKGLRRTKEKVANQRYDREVAIITFEAPLGPEGRTIEVGARRHSEVDEVVKACGGIWGVGDRDVLGPDVIVVNTRDLSVAANRCKS